MKLRYVILTTALLLGYGNGYSQENNVVLNYNQLTVGYTHLSSGDLDLDGNGIGLSASARYSNFVISTGLSNTWIEDTEANLLQVGVGVGYVFEMSDSLHLVPSITVDYEKIHDWEYYYADAWVFTPSVSLNYAASDALQLSVGIGYSDPFNVELLEEDISDYADGAFVGSLSAEYAISPSVGLRVGIGLSENQNAYGIGLSWHY